VAKIEEKISLSCKITTKGWKSTQLIILFEKTLVEKTGIPIMPLHRQGTTWTTSRSERVGKIKNSGNRV